jgi:hypothetical protein
MKNKNNGALIALIYGIVLGGYAVAMYNSIPKEKKDAAKEALKAKADAFKVKAATLFTKPVENKEEEETV